MNLLASLSAKIILGLSLALALSLAGNAKLLQARWQAYGEAKGEAQRAKIAGELETYRRSDAIAKGLADRATDDHAALLDTLDAIVQRGRAVRTVYSRAAAKAPLAAACLPGRERMDAVNAGLSGVSLPVEASHVP